MTSSSKLTPEQQQQVVERVLLDEESYSSVAKAYGVSATTIKRIVKKREDELDPDLPLAHQLRPPVPQDEPEAQELPEPVEEPPPTPIPPPVEPVAAPSNEGASEDKPLVAPEPYQPRTVEPEPYSVRAYLEGKGHRQAQQVIEHIAARNMPNDATVVVARGHIVAAHVAEVDVLIVDADGNEPVVVAGLANVIRHRRPRLYVTSPSKASRQRIANALRGTRYRLIEVIPAPQPVSVWESR